jgi:hypothetical protein
MPELRKGSKTRYAHSPKNKSAVTAIKIIVERMIIQNPAPRPNQDGPKLSITVCFGTLTYPIELNINDVYFIRDDVTLESKMLNVNAQCYAYIASDNRVFLADDLQSLQEHLKWPSR